MCVFCAHGERVLCYLWRTSLHGAPFLLRIGGGGLQGRQEGSVGTWGGSQVSARCQTLYWTGLCKCTEAGGLRQEVRTWGGVWEPRGPSAAETWADSVIKAGIGPRQVHLYIGVCVLSPPVTCVCVEVDNCSPVYYTHHRIVTIVADPPLIFHLFLTTGLNKVIDIYPTEAVNLPVNFTPVSLSQWPLVLPPVVFNLFFSFTEIINVGFRIVACLSCSSWGQPLKVELDVLKPLENIKCSV